MISGVVGGVVGGGKSFLQFWSRTSSDGPELTKSDSLGRYSATFDAKFASVQSSADARGTVSSLGR